ncbi:bacteriocin immunity protein [Pseudomonas sp. S60]|uniref:bacteriocin immunity protein n=1 Tax=unclassified Pseudomonas TaxID=196821 RepID=UPI0019142284|nr:MULTISPECIES: bacteriocin immunity protein [unclassified Pseudomonas]MBK4989842.1 bacteriocin immunity protein [Pseudomonas sp. S36]MBK5003454.1 bacteriocin immunity protein [Pseudomonas sp. S32]MBK5009978.1 bacteriocin immunity protein [Pseudomonas sp. S60]
MQEKISDYTEQEFFRLVYGIYHADPVLYPSDRAHSSGIIKFEKLSEHPKGCDVIFKPSKVGIKDSPQAIVDEVKRWRQEQGLPGFKDA